MKRPQKASSIDTPQIEKFRQAAHALGADESDDAFEAALAKVAKAPKLSDEEIKELARNAKAQRKK